MVINSYKEFLEVANKLAIKQHKNNIIIDDYEWLSAEVKVLQKKGIDISIFTVINGDGDLMYLENGKWWADRMGYIVLKEGNIKILEDGFQI